MPWICVLKIEGFAKFGDGLVLLELSSNHRRAHMSNLIERKENTPILITFRLIVAKNMQIGTYSTRFLHCIWTLQQCLWMSCNCHHLWRKSMRWWVQRDPQWWRRRKQKASFWLVYCVVALIDWVKLLSIVVGQLYLYHFYVGNRILNCVLGISNFQHNVISDRCTFHSKSKITLGFSHRLLFYAHNYCVLKK